MTRICGWSHPDLARLLKYEKISLFIDGTFRCVPKPFTQLMVIMTFDAGVCYFLQLFSLQEVIDYSQF